MVWVPIHQEQQEQGDPGTGTALAHQGAVPPCRASVVIVTGPTKKLVTKLSVTLV